MAIIIWSVTFALGAFVDAKFYHAHFPFVIAFFLMSSVGLHAAIIASLSENPKRFPAYFMGITGLKLMAYLLSISIYVVIYQESGIPVLILFLILYVLFTALELFSLLPKVKNSSPNEEIKKR